MAKACTHLGAIRDVTPSALGCQECLQTGDAWFHLRICRICGHVGCCDQSPGRHATKHFHATRHPIIEGYDPPEAWGWCYIDEAILDLSDRKYRRSEKTTKNGGIGGDAARIVIRGAGDQPRPENVSKSWSVRLLYCSGCRGDLAIEDGQVSAPRASSWILVWCNEFAFERFRYEIVFHRSVPWPWRRPSPRICHDLNALTFRRGPKMSGQEGERFILDVILASWASFAPCALRRDSQAKRREGRHSRIASAARLSGWKLMPKPDTGFADNVAPNIRWVHNKVARAQLTRRRSKENDVAVDGDHSDRSASIRRKEARVPQ
jgi:hypothetical protein